MGRVINKNLFAQGISDNIFGTNKKNPVKLDIALISNFAFFLTAIVRIHFLDMPH